MYSCWGLKGRRPIGEPGNRGAAGDQSTPGRGIRVQVIVSLTPWESQSLLQGVFPVPPGGLSQPAAGADQLGEALHLPRARGMSDCGVGTGAAWMSPGQAVQRCLRHAQRAAVQPLPKLTGAGFRTGQAIRPNRPTMQLARTAVATDGRLRGPILWPSMTAFV